MRLLILTALLLTATTTPAADTATAPTAKPAVTVSEERPGRPLPKFVQKLSPEDYKLWAAWQNRQAELRQTEETNDPMAPRRYASASRLTTVAAGYASSVSQAYSVGGGGGRSGKGCKGGGGGKRDYGGNAITGYSDLRTGSVSATERNTMRYLNPDYAPKSRLLMNPYVKPNETGTIGEPDWDNIFVPCKEGTMTMTEAMDAQRGPVNPEKLYAKLMAPYFLD
ncbi:MAG: hypothetical protein ABFC88_13145 [Thermoguttaceae bacterium]